MKKIDEEIASILMQSKAIKLQPANPFTWASGWKSPIYCDNRKTLSYPEYRSKIKDNFISIIKEKYPDVEVIAGVATGAIAHAAIIADEMNLPLVYIRPQAKKHGLGNQIEGVFAKGNKIVVIEDLVSTGKSSLNAVEVLRENGANILGMIAIFTYGFPEADQNFKDLKCELTTLSNYNTLIDTAISTGYIGHEYTNTLAEWRKDPANWS